MQLSFITLVSFVGAIFQVVGGGLCIVAMVAHYDWKSSDRRLRFGWPWNAPNLSDRGRSYLRIGFPILLIGVCTSLYSAGIWR